ncbi:chaplin [Streptomyces abyssalis]|uniref:Chaplin n=1 Tax=Streptomyces abyssalis TaxID=933944 RepID=A0A1E7JUK2_9ACTN|nr:chaplin [Streptomyces abyssalis]OEU89373.1 chaplin [Streptomyces abyssalis]OEU93656.1 chaplin [Streptomyces abyssalis]OEV32036.1 chaplin [Streptomyces nanshensis]
MIKKVAAVAAAAGGLMLAGAGVAAADQGVAGAAGNAPGVASGNNVQAPVHVPLNVCGNTVSVIGNMNMAGGNACPGN